MISRQKTELRRLKSILQPSALIFLLAALLTGCASAPAVPPVPTPIPGALYVNAEQSIGAISPLVFGTNYGPWVFLMPAVKPKAIEAGLTYLRYPGGEYGDNADLMEYQIDEAAASAKELGAELSLCVRLMNGTPENAALMVKFPDMQHDEPYMAHVPPGQTGEIVWTFNRAGTFGFACLIAGHYQAGMVGQVVVTARR